MSWFAPQNPGIGGLNELTASEEVFVMNLAGLSYQQGDILYYNGTSLTRLGAGTSGQYLKTLGTGANPVWDTVSGGVTGATDSSLTLTGTTLGFNYANAGTFTGQQKFTSAQTKIYNNNSGNQLFVGNNASEGYWLGRNTGTGFLDVYSTQGSPFDGIQVAFLRASVGITINGENVIRNWSSSLGIGNYTGTASAMIEIRGATQDFLIGGGTGYAYLFQRNSSTGFFEITGQQAGYTGYIFNTGNGSNAHTINDTGNSGFGVAIGSVTAQVDISASTTARASLRIRSGTAPTSPNDGDIWFDGTDIKMRISGTTKTFTLT